MHIVELIILNIRQFVRVLGLFCNVIVMNMLMSAIFARIVKKISANVCYFFVIDVLIECKA